jgi:hypothetical protein
LEILGHTIEPEADARTIFKKKRVVKPIVYDQPFSHTIDDGVLIVLPGQLPPGLNEIKRMNKKYEYPRVKKSWMWLIFAALQKNHRSFERARIEMTCYRIGADRMDRDNTEASFKIPGDALRDLHIIPDDNQHTIQTEIKNIKVLPSQRHLIRTEMRVMEWK